MSRIRLTTMFNKHWIYHGSHIYIGDWRDPKSVWVRRGGYRSHQILRLFGRSPAYADVFEETKQWEDFTDWFYKHHRRGVWVEERDGELVKLLEQRTTKRCNQFAVRALLCAAEKEEMVREQVCWYLFCFVLGATLTAVSKYRFLSWQWIVADILLLSLAAASR